MRTTVDLPEPIFRRAKEQAAKRKTTLRSLMVSALTKELDKSESGPEAGFVMRDVSVGGGGTVSEEQIAQALREDREFKFDRE